MNCKKEPIDGAGLEVMLAEFQRVLVVNGKKLLELSPELNRQEIVSQAIGRSGNLRAPCVSHGGLLIVGFSESAYRQL